MRNFWVEKREQKKRLGYYEIENIDNPCFVTLAVNPKEYFEIFKNLKSNKKHKSIEKGSCRMDFENFANRIKLLVNFDTFKKPLAEYKEVCRFTVFQEELIKKLSLKQNYLNLTTKDFLYQTELFPSQLVA